ncbi:MAG: DNA polymerase III subunit chi [Gammaproteobacteria bacterium]|nr:DNA polymerase III subunit chi [Gammaproteobacteria bacterium]MCP4091089.1 DNA polymerase III subunit chi [Gammaproteobacteria bacterium]MCP4277385.1 DNA polymerase III subunit chi [Gammaproteobacteria bacterium]MCP4831554.1 DNA polymerase III subunit chi [Gammaproteobacteria bacterium]MCP4927777.1 DNA polymerase III subunit chi [Gammaproteobacteria bacterium]
MQAKTRVNFYILNTVEPASRLNFACRLTEKAYSLNNRVYAHTATPRDAQQLDEMLWTFRQGSFVPHQLLTDAGKHRAPVSIGTNDTSEKNGDLLINLAEAIPEFISGFQRVAEIICSDEQSRQIGRERFKNYRRLGIEPETHQISK